MSHSDLSRKAYRISNDYVLDIKQYYMKELAFPFGLIWRDELFSFFPGGLNTIVL